jgi:hypothetical protein
MTVVHTHPVGTVLLISIANPPINASSHAVRAGGERRRRRPGAGLEQACKPIFMPAVVAPILTNAFAIGIATPIC